MAEWLGHADPSFTLKIYTHLMPSSADRTKSVIGNLYSRRPEKASDTARVIDKSSSGSSEALWGQIDKIFWETKQA
ncbi:hypothetical protein [Actinophytocola sp.]|uniref:hypothetical protein n=1 Tax=Actinophytocola sp. TaxID=1872138 RepID=UPI003899E2E1